MRGINKLIGPKLWVLLNLAAIVCFLGQFALPAWAEQLSADEYSVKAAFLFNLAKFVDWPPAKFQTDKSPMILGVIGDAALERVSAVIKNKSIGSHLIEVRSVNSPEEARLCHILFITRSAKEGEVLIAAASRSSALVVGETETFLEGGGMVRFYLDAGSVRLEINTNAIKNGGVAIQSAALSALVNKGIARLRKL